MNGNNGDKGVLLLSRVKGHPAADDLERILNRLLDRIPEAEVVMETLEDSLFVFPAPDGARRFAEQLLSTLRTASHTAPQAARLVVDTHQGALEDPEAHMNRLRRDAAAAKPGTVTRAAREAPASTPPAPETPAVPAAPEKAAEVEPAREPDAAPEPEPPSAPAPPEPTPAPVPRLNEPRPGGLADAGRTPASPQSSGWFNRPGAPARPNPFSDASTASIKPRPEAPPASALTPLGGLGNPSPPPVDEGPPASDEIEVPEAEPEEPAAPDTPGDSVRLINPTVEPVGCCEVSRGPRTRRLLLRTEPRLTLGRSRKDCDLVTWVMPRSEKNDELSRMVSSVHCRLLLTSDAIVVKHLSSVNPTHVNSVRITKPGALPLDRQSSLILSANFSLHITPLRIGPGFEELSRQWCDVISEAGRRRWEWSARFGIGGLLLERRDGLVEREAYLWLLSAVELREDLTVSSDGAGCGVCLAALPWPAFGNHALAGVSVDDRELPMGSLALLTSPQQIRTPRGDLTVNPFSQDLETAV
ncbi:MAG: FHA domain-containing protein [Phycisphaerales bacterium]|nr:FHA domain-containing protein [Phycisphaerales bacterium]